MELAWIQSIPSLATEMALEMVRLESATLEVVTLEAVTLEAVVILNLEFKI